MRHISHSLSLFDEAAIADRVLIWVVEETALCDEPTTAEKTAFSISRGKVNRIDLAFHIYLCLPSRLQ